MNGRRYIITGGGTSGHVNPALAIAREILDHEPDAQIRYFGTARGIEADLAARAGLPFTAIPARPLPTRPTPALLRAVLTYWKGKRACRSLMKNWRPDAVIGTGGYVCSPVVAAAASCRVPVLLHEQNAWPGRSNRLMARRSQAVCVAFPGTEKHFPAGTRVKLTGNPVLPVFFSTDRQAARKSLHPQSERPFILAMGGSLGAQTINRAVLGLRPWIEQQRVAGRPLPRLVLAAGKRQFAEVASAAAECSDWLEVQAYIHGIHAYMSAADLLICRAGALTCSEIAALGIPSILVPYPYAAGDHQTYNARVLADAGAALLCPDDQMTASWLADQLDQLLADHDRLANMGRQAGTLARPDAAAAIYSQLMDIMKP